MSRVIRLAVGALATVAFLAAAIVLELSDRVGHGFGGFAHSSVERLQRVEQRTDIDLIDRGDIPLPIDDLAHVVLWAAGMMIVGFAFRRQVPLLVLAVVVFAISAGFELAQHLLTTLRRAELSDVVANGMGIAGATLVVAVVGWVADRRSAVRV